MDLLVIAYYAVLGGLLTLLAPAFGNFLVRLVVGLIAGGAAALSLPLARPLIEDAIPALATPLDEAAEPADDAATEDDAPAETPDPATSPN